MGHRFFSQITFLPEIGGRATNEINPSYKTERYCDRYKSGRARYSSSSMENKMMEKPAGSEANPGEIEKPEFEINSYIKQLMTLRKSIEKSVVGIEYWKNQKSKLLESNSFIEMNCEKLSRQVSDIEEKILENTRIHIAKKQELKDLQNARKNVAHKQWNDCLSKIDNYANDFSQWIRNYSRDVLMKEIENHRDGCRKVNEELAILKQEVEDMQKEFKLDCIDNVEDDDLSTLEIVTSDLNFSNNNLTKNIELEEDMLNKIQNKIEQSKIILNESKTKEKTNVF
ncbi:putative leucine-rich repeat-containing protein DDB_G0290503 isoform X2 [Cardiocondyla obscurior]|uniref:putative leucine-rich repeat-containing protein DDB_G0290503 isoform X2 n=1 Tax=Cardiocondyla obscurior TaxID=286306 RepID=UPI00396580F1